MLTFFEYIFRANHHLLTFFFWLHAIFVPYLCLAPPFLRLLHLFRCFHLSLLAYLAALSVLSQLLLCAPFFFPSASPTFSLLFQVKNPNLIRNRDNDTFKGFAFVDVESEEDMNKCIQELNGAYFGDRALIVNEVTCNCLPLSHPPAPSRLGPALQAASPILLGRGGGSTPHAVFTQAHIYNVSSLCLISEFVW